MTNWFAPAGREVLERLADAALTAVDGAAGAEAVITREWGGLARFAGSQIHQHVATETVSLRVRVVTSDGRVGVAVTGTTEPAEAAATAARALAIARVSPVDPEFPGLAEAAPVPTVPVDDATMAATPDDRAAGVRELLAEVPTDVDAAGAWSTGGTELCVVNTTGQRAYAPLSHAALTLVATDAGGGSGYAEAGGRAASEVDIAGCARRAVAKAQASGSPGEVDAGAWTVVLEPAAVGTLVQFLGYLGFGGREFIEGRSFAAGRLGEPVCDPRVTIADDATSPDTVGFPFDWEGTPKRRVPLIEAGVLRGVVHDRWTASRLGVESTGHGLPAPNPEGPIALNPLMSPGDDGSVDDLVAGCERGLLVTRFHYTNVVHPVETSITGMTRDGTFLIEDGKVVGAVRNLRFTQSILDALSALEAISTETAYASELFFGGSRCPALRVANFAFTSTTTF